MLPEVLETVRGILQYHYGDSAPLQILLVAEIRIHGDERIKMTLRQFQ